MEAYAKEGLDICLKEVIAECQMVIDLPADGPIEELLGAAKHALDFMSNIADELRDMLALAISVELSTTGNAGAGREMAERAEKVRKRIDAERKAVFDEASADLIRRLLR